MKLSDYKKDVIVARKDGYCLFGDTSDTMYIKELKEKGYSFYSVSENKIVYPSEIKGAIEEYIHERFSYEGWEEDFDDIDFDNEIYLKGINLIEKFIDKMNENNIYEIDESVKIEID